MAAKTRASLLIEAQKRGEGAFREFNESLADLGRKAGLAGAAAAAGLAAITASSFRTIDALAKTSDKLGVATEDLASLRLAGELTGVEAGKLDIGLQRMTRRIAEIALTGRGEAKPALDELGLSIEELAGLNATQQFEKIAGAMSQVEVQSQRVALGFKLFDSEGVDLIRTLDLGSAGLADVAEQADRLGIAVSRFDAAKIELANDSITLLKAGAKGVGNTLAVEVAPLIVAVSNAFLQAGLDSQTMAETFRKGVDVMVTAAGWVGDAIFGWKLIIDGVALSVSRIELAFSQANDFLRGLFGEAEEAAGNLEDYYNALAPKLPEEARASLRESIDLQIAALDLEGSRTDELEAQYQAQVRVFEALASSEKPSAALARNLAEARAEVDRLAQSRAELAEARTFVPPDIDVSETAEDQLARERAEREAERQKAALERSLEAVREGTLSRLEVEREAIGSRLEVLRLAFEAELIDQERFYELSADVARKGQERITEITEEGFSERQKFAVLSTQAQAAHVLGALATMTAGVAQHNKTLFRINKLAAIGNAVVSTAAGITKAIEAYPPPLSIAMAAVQAAAGAAQIQAIRSTQFGGGTTPSVAGSVPVLNDQPVPTVPEIARDASRDAPRIEVNVNGAVVGMGGAEELVDFIEESLRDRLDNRDAVIFSSTSRQATI